MLGNPYFIGFLLLVTEVTINLIFGSTVVSSVALGYAAGALFVSKNKIEMLFSDKIKVLAVYLVAVVGISLLSTMTDEFESSMLYVLFLLVALYGVFTYLMMSLGSSLTFKALQKKKEEAADTDSV